MGFGHVFLAYKGGFGLKILELRKADVELNIHVVVLMDMDAFKREAKDGQCMICVFNKAPTAQKRTIEVGKILRNNYWNLLNTRDHYTVHEGKLDLMIPAYGALLLVAGKGTVYTPSHVSKSRIIIRYNTGFGNSLFIRGDTLPLRWDSGHRCENVDAETWLFEMERPQNGEVQFKVLLNDTVWEKGENHYIAATSELHARNIPVISIKRYRVDDAGDHHAADQQSKHEVIILA